MEKMVERAVNILRAYLWGMLSEEEATQKFNELRAEYGLESREKYDLSLLDKWRYGP